MGWPIAAAPSLRCPSRRAMFWSRAEALKIDRPVIAELRKGHRNASFVRPELRVRARHLRGGDTLRHATLTAVQE